MSSGASDDLAPAGPTNSALPSPVSVSAISDRRGSGSAQAERMKGRLRRDNPVVFTAHVVIRTQRLDLIPMTPAFLRASLDGDRDRAAATIGLRLPETWPDAPSLLALRLGELESDPTLQPWLLRAMGLRQTGELVGYIGCHTAPGAPYLDQWSPGAVEFGFTVCPPHRRQGFAREAAVALMRWASDEHLVASFVLTISPNNAPSLALAASLGFTRVGSHMDEEDGPEDVFVLDAPREGR